MKRIKSMVLAIMMVMVFVLPVMAEETTDTSDVAQKIANVRSMEVCGEITLDARIFDLTTELQIRRLKIEPDTAFIGAISQLAFPVSDAESLSLKGRRFNCIALMSMYGFISDDEAIAQLQALSLVP